MLFSYLISRFHKQTAYLEGSRVVGRYTDPTALQVPKVVTQVGRGVTSEGTALPGIAMAHAPGPVEQHFGDLSRVDVQECLLYHEHDDDSGRYRYKVVRAGTRRRGETEFRWFGSPDLPTTEAMHLYWLAMDKGLIFTRMFHYNGNKDDEKEELRKKQKSRYEPLEHVGGKFISEAMRKHSRKVREAKAAGVQPTPFRARKAVQVNRGADEKADGTVVGEKRRGRPVGVKNGEGIRARRKRDSEALEQQRNGQVMAVLTSAIAKSRSGRSNWPVRERASQRSVPAVPSQEQDSDDDEAPSDSVPIAGSNELSIGSLVVAKDKHGGWYNAKVIAAMQTAKQVMTIGGGVDFQQWQVHFEGWHKRHDEWLAFSDGRIRWRKAPPPPAASPPPAGFARKRPAFDLNYSSSSDDDDDDDDDDDVEDDQATRDYTKDSDEEGCDGAQDSAAFATGPRREGEEPMDEDAEVAAQDESSSSDEEEMPLRPARRKPPMDPVAPIPGMVRTDSSSPERPSVRSQASSDAAGALLQVADGAIAAAYPITGDEDSDDEDVMVSSLATK